MVVFDLDGTLVDSVPQIARSVNWALARRRLAPHREERYRDWIGDGLDPLVRRALDASSSALSSTHITRHAARHYRHHAIAHTSPFSGITTLLEQLKKRGYQFSVLTNKSEPVASRMVGALFAKGVFDYVVGGRRGRLLKPHPAALQALLRRHNAEREHRYMVGDSIIDYRTAMGANINFVAAGWGYGDMRLLQKRYGVRVASEPLDLLDILP